MPLKTLRVAETIIARPVLRHTDGRRDSLQEWQETYHIYLGHNSGDGFLAAVRKPMNRNGIVGDDRFDVIVRYSDLEPHATR